MTTFCGHAAAICGRVLRRKADLRRHTSCWNAIKSTLSGQQGESLGPVTARITGDWRLRLLWAFGSGRLMHDVVLMVRGNHGFTPGNV